MNLTLKTNNWFTLFGVTKTNHVICLLGVFWISTLKVAYAKQLYPNRYLI